MSWSVQFIGTPEKVANALEEQSAKLEGQSKIEYDDALPHMKALVMQNFAGITPTVKITANGHGYATTDGEQKQRHFVVSIEPAYGVLV